MSKKDKKINVLQIISALNVGGAEKLLIDFLKASKKDSDGFNFTVVVMNNKMNEDLKNELISIGYEVHFLDRKESHVHPKYLFQLLDIIKKNDINILHTHNSGGKLWSILCKILKPKLKTVFTVHDTNTFLKVNKLKHFLHKNFININIAISNAVLGDCYRFGINKVVKIYNGINISKFNHFHKKQLLGDVLYIINISRLVYKKKGQDVLIKALKVCKDKGMKFICNFVGGAYEYDKNSLGYLADLVQELQLEASIKFLGNRKDVPELLSQSDLFILPSRYEGLGLVVLEAMASHVPVVASNIDGPAELIQSDKNGLLFESENYLDLADKILYLYNNREAMSNLAQVAYEYVQDFDISNMCKKYLKLYEYLVKEK